MCSLLLENEEPGSDFLVKRWRDPNSKINRRQTDKESDTESSSREQETRLIQVAPMKQWFIKLTNYSINSINSVRHGLDGDHYLY